MRHNHVSSIPMLVHDCDSFLWLVCWFQPQNGSREGGIKCHNRSLQILQHSKSIYSITCLTMWCVKQRVWWSTTVANRTSAVSNSMSTNTFKLNGIFQKDHSTVRSASTLVQMCTAGSSFSNQKQPGKSISFQSRQELDESIRANHSLPGRSRISSPVLTNRGFVSSSSVFATSCWFIKEWIARSAKSTSTMCQGIACARKRKGTAIIERFQAAHATKWSKVSP